MDISLVHERLWPQHSRDEGSVLAMGNGLMLAYAHGADLFQIQVAISANSGLPGYESGVVLLALKAANHPAAEKVAALCLNLRDDTGAWSEYYAGTTAQGTRYRPWESALNLAGLLAHFAKPTLAVLVLVMACIAGCATGAAGRTPVGPATAATAPAKAPTTRPARLRSPEVLSDGRITFRLRAPEAKEVLLVGIWPIRLPLTRQSDGIWTITIDALGPGVWEYSFNVDGIVMLDPLNPAIKAGREPQISLFYVPGRPPLIYDFQNVPHGVVHQHTYVSKAVGRPREMLIYTPPGYDQDTQTRFPTLYLLHGSGDNQATWTVVGKAHWTLDNLIAQGQSKPMVVVMLDGHPGVERDNTALLERDLLQDVMPFVETNYRVKTDAAGRAITGASMGGLQSLTIGLKHPDFFAWVGSFSGVAPSRDVISGALRDAQATNRQLKLLWLACGIEDYLFAGNQQFITLLAENGIRYEWHTLPGGHGWWSWRTVYLSDFASRLF